MSSSDLEIVVEDPTAPEADSPSVVDTRTIEIAVSLLLLALAVALGYDNWRTGIAWDSTGPQPGYFPFYLSVILGGASLYGLVTTLVARGAAAETFVSRARNCAASCWCSCRQRCSVWLCSISASMSQASC